MRKVIVTGGAGFLGSHLVDELVKKKYKVIVIDNLSNGKLKNLNKVRNKIKFIKADISKYGVWTSYFKKDINCIIHLAALADIVPSINYPEKYYKTNVTGTINLLNLARQNKIKRFIYSASSSCYGIPKKYPTNEKDKINPLYPYALTKKIGEDFVLHWSKIYNIQATSLRFFNIYGTRSRTSGSYGAMFGVFLSQKINNKPFTVVGDGKQKRDFIFVSDAVSAIIKSLRLKQKNLILNIGRGKPITVNHICKLLKGKKIYIPKRPGEPDVTWANINLAKKKLKWHPKVDISEGVKILLNNLNHWENAPLWDKKKIKKATKDWFRYLS